MASATDIRKSNVIMFQNAPHIALEVEHRTQGRQSGFVQVTLRNLISGVSTKTKFHSNDTVDFCFVESRELEFSYVDDMGYHFLNTESYEDEVIPANLLKDQKDYLIQGTAYSVLFVEEKPVQTGKIRVISLAYHLIEVLFRQILSDCVKGNIIVEGGKMIAPKT